MISRVFACGITRRCVRAHLCVCGACVCIMFACDSKPGRVGIEWMEPRIVYPSGKDERAGLAVSEYISIFFNGGEAKKVVK